MSKIIEKMPTTPKSIKVVVPQGVQSVTIAFGDNNGGVKENTPKATGKKICD